MTTPLRLATFNVWGLPWPAGHRVAERMDAIGAHLPALDADVVAFEEVWTGDARSQLVEASRAAGLTNVWHAEAVRGGGGLLVATRLPVATARFTRFELRGLPERLTHGDYHGGKGFVRLDLELPGGPLALFATHLQARYAPVDADEYVGIRMGQVVQLAAAFRAAPGPLVALGDFNFDDDRPEYEALTGLAGLRDAAATLGRREPTVRRGHPFRSPREGDGRIDYVFARDGGGRGIRFASARRIFDAAPGAGLPAYSDHDGLLAEVAIAPGGSDDPAAVPPAAAIAAAREALEQGRRGAARRRRGERAGAAAALGAAGAAALVARRAGLSRRRLLRAGLLAGCGAGLAGALALGALADISVPAELEGYERALERLAAMGVPRAR